MRRSIGFLFAISAVFIFAGTLLAKRGAPKDVPPITRNGVTYSAPHERMGCVEAKEEKNGGVLWTKQIYVVKYDLELERDVQDCFVSELRFAENKLIVVNERGDEYQLDPATLAVKVLKGSEVVEKSAKK